MRRRSRHLPQPRLHHEKGAGHVVAQAHDSDSRGGDSKAATIGADPAGGWPGCVPPSAGVGCHPYVCTVARWRVPHVGAAAGGNCEERGGEEAGARDLRAQEQSNIRGEGKRDANTHPYTDSGCCLVCQSHGLWWPSVLWRSQTWSAIGVVGFECRHAIR